MDQQNDITLIIEPITKIEIATISQKRFGDMIKVVIDIEKEVMALGGELHADEEHFLLDQGSKQENLWGINIYHGLPREQWIEFDSMINIRPSQNNRSRSVENSELRQKITNIVDRLIKD